MDVNFGLIVKRYQERLSAFLKAARATPVFKAATRAFLLLCVAVIIQVPVQIYNFSLEMYPAVRVACKAGSLGLMIAMIFVAILLCLELLGLLFGVKISFQRLLYLLIGRGLYPSEE